MTVVAITPNPALDRTVRVPALHLGAVHRATEVIERAGGKGLNVARVIQQLDGAVIAIAPLAGATGQRVVDLAIADGIQGRWVWHDDETRTCTIVVTDDSCSTVINEAGTTGSGWWPALIEAVVEACGDDVGVVTISGNLPPGVGGDELVALIAAIRATSDAAVWVDASGAALQAASGTGCGIKVNLAEAAELLGADDLAAGPADAARRLLGASAARCVVVTDGERGAALAMGESVMVATPPPTTVRNATGSGDAFLAAFAQSIDTHRSMEQALVRAVAAGTANAMQVEPGIDPARFGEVVAQVAVSTHDVNLASATIGVSADNTKITTREQCHG